MSELTVAVYGDHSTRWVKFEYPFDLTDCDSIYASIGFIDKKSYLDPYFYVDSCCPFIEIISWRNPRTEQYIIELLDDDRALFSFLCYSEKELLKCLKDFMEMAQLRCSIERNLTYLYKNNKE